MLGDFHPLNKTLSIFANKQIMRETFANRQVSAPSLGMKQVRPFDRFVLDMVAPLLTSMGPLARTFR